MRVLIDCQALALLYRVDQLLIRREVRYYYAPRDDGALFCLVSRCGVLELITGEVVDAAIGWSVGWHGKCHPSHDGLQLMKVTLFRQLSEKNYDTTLSELVNKSRSLPRRKPPRGAKWAKPYGFDPEER